MNRSQVLKDVDELLSIGSSASVLKFKKNVFWILWSRIYFSDNKNNWFSGWSNRYFGWKRSTDRRVLGGFASCSWPNARTSHTFRFLPRFLVLDELQCTMEPWYIQEAVLSSRRQLKKYVYTVRAIWTYVPTIPDGFVVFWPRIVRRISFATRGTDIRALTHKSIHSEQVDPWKTLKQTLMTNI